MVAEAQTIEAKNDKNKLLMFICDGDFFESKNLLYNVQIEQSYIFSFEPKEFD